MQNLFLQQSCIDAWTEYWRSIRKAKFPRWDYVILTSSNEAQAEAFRRQIGYRLERGLLPAQTKYLVLPDPDGKRIGSGGATFHVLEFLSRTEGFGGNFHGKRILVIHSGGDSKRVPQYSVCGKLFSPVPRELPDGRASTLFDEFMIAMAGVPSRFKEGMLVLSGDVLLLFNPLQIDAQFSGAAAISMKSPVEIGVDHGVFLSDGSDQVKMFLHKQSEARLRELGAVNAQNCVNLDTGAVLMDAELVETLYSLIDTKEKYDAFVNETARISFYGDFLYPLASEATLEQYYREQPEGSLCQELHDCRTILWEALSPYTMKLICLSPAEFIHFGTTRELRSMMTEEVADYEFLGWKRAVFSNVEDCGGGVHTSLIDEGVRLGPGSYIENSILRGKTSVGAGAVISNCVLEDAEVAENAVLHGVRLRSRTQEYLVRTYGVSDNPKRTLEQGGTFLKGTLASLLADNGLTAEELWDDDDHSLWTARLFPAFETSGEAVRCALLLERMSAGPAPEGEVADWKRRERFSLQSSFAAADTARLLQWKQELEDAILVEKFLERIRAGEYYIPALKTFGEHEISESHYRLLMQKKDQAGFSEKIRILYDVSRSMEYKDRTFDGRHYDDLERECFETIASEIAAHSPIQTSDDHRIVRDEVCVRLPVRVNWGGGWTDTPPYCNENGGVVLNAALRLNGEDPIEVCIRRCDALEVQFASLDMGAEGSAATAAEIQDCHNPYDPFALHKAAVIACGILPAQGEADLREILARMGGGFYISTCVTGIPKGSGLGTSSILSGACVRAFSEFLGKGWSDEEIYDTVLNLEQIMSTGGGWQDQVGGLIPGVKFITSEPGMHQRLHVEQVRLSEATKRELQERFVLIYTGQRRLARNLLRDVIGSYLGGRPETLDALEQMQKLAVLMRFELERGSIDEFAKLLNQHWEASRQLDEGSTNTCIDQIFRVCADMLDGRFICGAGGGGFLQGILKKGVSKADLSARLRSVFQEAGVDVWDCQFV